MVMKSIKKIVPSIDFWKIAIPVTVPLLAAILAWYMAESGKVRTPDLMKTVFGIF